MRETHTLVRLSQDAVKERYEALEHQYGEEVSRAGHRLFRYSKRIPDFPHIYNVQWLRLFNDVLHGSGGSPYTGEAEAE